jgi:hypothetical protein
MTDYPHERGSDAGAWEASVKMLSRTEEIDWPPNMAAAICKRDTCIADAMLALRLYHRFFLTICAAALRQNGGLYVKPEENSDLCCNAAFLLLLRKKHLSAA